MSTSALYGGIVHHRRFGDPPHALRYRMMMALLDLDEIDTLAARCRLFARNRFALFSFHDRDHLPKDAAPGASLRALVDGQLREAGLPTGGAIRLLTLPRILGFAFNPLSVFFCHAPEGGLTAILYEVNNTFGQRHTYVIPVDASGDRIVRQRCEKRFYVSPFLGMDLVYDFRIEPPGESVGVGVDGSRDGKRAITASFAGRRHAFSDRRLLAAFLAYPLVNLAVVAGIHWEALKLWRKGARFHRRPEPPPHSATFVQRSEV